MKRSEIEQLLPSVFQRTVRPQSPLAALLDVMEALHAPSEHILSRIETYFHPYRSPDYFVAYLAGWVDLNRFLLQTPEDAAAGARFPAGLGRLRELIAAAALLSKWRGTARGLQLFLETATGIAGYAVDEQVPGEDGRPLPFHIRIRAPAEAAPYAELIERIVQMEKPAYVTSELAFEA